MARSMRLGTPLAVFALLALAGAAAVADDGPTRVRYDDHRLVRVELDDKAQLETMLSISSDCWCESVSVGVRDFRVTPEQFERLRATDIDFVVLNENLQLGVERERTRLDAADAVPAAAGLGSWFADFKDYADIVARLQALQAAHPEIATLVDIGDSLEGRDIWAMRITGPGADKPAVLFNSCQHAREWISPMTTMYIVDELLSNYGVDPQLTGLVDAVEFFVIPVVNPDGYEFSWDFQRYWRKNRRDNGDGTFGVDTNRNWGFEWGGEGSSGDSNNETYRGTAPFSEPETQVMRDFYVANPNIVTSIDFHSYGQLVLYPWAYQFGGPGDAGEHALLGEVMRQSILDTFGQNYVAGPVGDTLYLAAGGSVDWSWGDQGVISYTIELRGNDFVIDPSQILPTGAENLAASLALAEGAAVGLLYEFPEGRPDTLPADTATTLRVDITSVSAGPLNPGSGRLLWRIDETDSFTETAMTFVSGTRFEATLPAVPCGETLSYYLEVESGFAITYASPLSAPDGFYQAQSIETITAFADDFQSDLGWTVVNEALTDGGWDRGVPAGGGDRGDPAVDYDGSGACYLTDNEDGNSDVDGGPTRLSSPTIDVTALDDPFLSYARWFTNDDNDIDRLDVELSNDGGGTWTLVESVGNSGGWTETSVRVADFLTPTSTMVVRFSATDNPNDSVTEAAVDAVRFIETGCPGGGVPGDVDGDGDVDFNDLLEVLSNWGPCTGCPQDLDGDGTVGFQDVLMVLANWS